MPQEPKEKIRDKIALLEAKKQEINQQIKQLTDQYALLKGGDLPSLNGAQGVGPGELVNESGVN